MTKKVRADTRNMAVQLNSVYRLSPENYFYIKGFIHCLLQKNAPNPRSKQGVADSIEYNLETQKG